MKDQATEPQGTAHLPRLIFDDRGLDWAAIGREYATKALAGGIPQVTSPQYALAGTLTAMAQEIEALRDALVAASRAPAATVLQQIVDRFKTDEEQGYRSSTRTYVLEMARIAIPDTPSPHIEQEQRG